MMRSSERSSPVSRSTSDSRKSCASGAGKFRRSKTSSPAVPPPYLTSKSTTFWAATGGSSGSAPRSKRLDASLASLWRRADLAMETGSKCAASISTLTVSSAISVSAPPMTPAIPRTRSAPSSVMRRSSGSRVRSTSSSVVCLSPALARRTTIGPRILSRS